jgi:hypothetical protein
MVEFWMSFGVIAGLLVLGAVFGGIGVIGYKIYKRTKKNKLQSLKLF